ncbi:MAG: helix-turn-helix transcriptional regulator [Nonomuraea sp.]|nr:helix-turn-helix transcriptional regulator [Streptomyces sp.]NUP76751.1 helix-turn-helix transcriptional regulator [Nonomuraea sp.]NUS01603.1 helix-turn-helix transcriptional regulator [Nonomuraea sp.]
MADPLDPDMFAACGHVTPIRVGDKWTAKIIRCLESGPRRFTELQVPLRGITPKVLTESLRAMERDGLLTRTAYDQIPPRVDYELTPLGRSLLVPMAATCEWSRQHLRELIDARESWYAAETLPASAR